MSNTKDFLIFGQNCFGRAATFVGAIQNTAKAAKDAGLPTPTIVAVSVVPRDVTVHFDNGKVFDDEGNTYPVIPLGDPNRFPPRRIGANLVHELANVARSFDLIESAVDLAIMSEKDKTGLRLLLNAAADHFEKITKILEAEGGDNE